MKLECHHVLFILMSGTINESHPVGVGWILSINEVRSFFSLSYLSVKVINLYYANWVSRPLTLGCYPTPKGRKVCHAPEG